MTPSPPGQCSSDAAQPICAGAPAVPVVPQLPATARRGARASRQAVPSCSACQGTHPGSGSGGAARPHGRSGGRGRGCDGVMKQAQRGRAAFKPHLTARLPVRMYSTELNPSYRIAFQPFASDHPVKKLKLTLPHFVLSARFDTPLCAFTTHSPAAFHASPCCFVLT